MCIYVYIYIYIYILCEKAKRARLIYKYNIPVGFPPGITSLREDCRWKPHRDVISVLLYRTNANTKGGKITNTRHFG